MWCENLEFISNSISSRIVVSPTKATEPFIQRLISVTVAFKILDLFLKKGKLDRNI